MRQVLKAPDIRLGLFVWYLGRKNSCPAVITHIEGNRFRVYSFEELKVIPIDYPFVVDGRTPLARAQMRIAEEEEVREYLTDQGVYYEAEKNRLEKEARAAAASHAKCRTALRFLTEDTIAMLKVLEEPNAAGS